MARQYAGIASPGFEISCGGWNDVGEHGKQGGVKAAHMVSAWATEKQLVLAQVKTADKSIEITAIPELLRMITQKGAIVTLCAIPT
jgi:hypothetical protein